MGRHRLPEIAYEPPTAQDRVEMTWAHCPDCRRDWPLEYFTAKNKCKNCYRAYQRKFGRKNTPIAHRRLPGTHSGK